MSSEDASHSAPSDGAFARLPKWAQNDIVRLSRNVKYYEDKLAEGPKESDTFASRGGIDQPLGTGENIRFKFEDCEAPNGHRYTKDITVRITTGYHKRRHLVVHGDETLLIVPNASNSVKIYLRDK